MGKIFSVTSGKGGVGKSTFSVGVACAFAKMGNKVLLVDMDEGLRCLDLMLSVSESLVFDICDVLLGKPLEEAVCKVRGFEHLHLLAAPNEIGRIDGFSFAAFAQQAEKEYDILIFDFPAGVDFKLCESLPNKTTHLVVVTPDIVCIRDAAAVCERLEQFSDNIRMVLNKFDIKLMKTRVFSNVDEAIDSTGIQLIGIVPLCDELLLACATGKPVKRGRAQKAFARIAKRLNGQAVKLPKPKKI